MGDKNLLLLRTRIPLLVDEGVYILMLAYEAKDFIPRAKNGEDRRHGHIEFYEGIAILNTTHQISHNLFFFNVARCHLHYQTHTYPVASVMPDSLPSHGP